MLRIYDDVVQVQRDLRAVFERIRLHDAALADRLDKIVATLNRLVRPRA